ncbi:MAG: hypothetical protein HZC36_16375 [Armatimonadetes bacterium]|nr:hypothetical protein [Armatimonadota bacterium]
MKLLIIVVIVLAGMFVIGARAGIVDIPGLSPAKKAGQAAKGYATDADPARVTKDDEKPTAESAAEPEKTAEVASKDVEKPKAPTPVEPEIDPLAGEKSLARVWKGLDAAVIAPMVRTWKDEELARQFAAMSPKQVGEILALLPPDRASKLSILLQKRGVEDAKIAAKSERS